MNLSETRSLRDCAIRKDFRVVPQDMSEIPCQVKLGVPKNSGVKLTNRITLRDATPPLVQCTAAQHCIAFAAQKRNLAPDFARAKLPIYITIPCERCVPRLIILGGKYSRLLVIRR